MTRIQKSALILALGQIFYFSATAQEVPQRSVRTEFSGDMGGEYRYYYKEGLYAGQEQDYFSVTFSPKMYMEWAKSQSFTFEGFGRLDQYKYSRTHVDLREFYWQTFNDKWELNVGIKQIFWGVAEANNVVDVINQADFLEGFDQEKLGQPMVQITRQNNWGVIDLFYLPYFREIRFPGRHGRLRPENEVDYDATIYESSEKEWHPGFAARWSNSVKIFDLGLSHFYGTARAPVFVPRDPSDIPLEFVPFYEIIHQSGIDLQALTGPMLWKFEGIFRQSERKEIIGYVAGGEYTFSNVFRSGADFGLIAEYNFDDRGDELLTGLNNDVFVGTRIALNDRQSSDLLGGVIMDIDFGSRTYFVEVNRRIGSTWKISLTGRMFDIDQDDLFLYLLREDGFGQIELKHYF